MQVEFFSADCRLCETALERWSQIFPISTMEIRRASECVDGSCCRRAAQVGVQAVPALAINGRVVFTGVPQPEDLERVKAELDQLVQSSGKN